MTPVPLLLVTALVAVGSQSAEPTRLGAVDAPAMRGHAAESQDREPQDDRLDDAAFWRGRPPRMCLVRECPSAAPTFCFVRGPTGVAKTPSDVCDRKVRIRDAQQGAGSALPSQATQSFLR